MSYTELLWADIPFLIIRGVKNDTKKCKLLLLVMVLFALSIPNFYARPASEQTSLTVSFSPTIDFADTRALENAITEAANAVSGARDILANTRVSVDGRDIYPHDILWATAGDHRAFEEAIDAVEVIINAAQGTLEDMQSIGHFSAGDVIDMTIGVQNNPGFAGIVAMVYVPEGLELTHIQVGEDGPRNWSVEPEGYITAEGELENPIVGPNYYILGAFGTRNFATENVESLFVYTFKVSDDAPHGATDQIRFEYASNVRCLGRECRPDCRIRNCETCPPCTVPDCTPEERCGRSKYVTMYPNDENGWLLNGLFHTDNGETIRRPYLGLPNGDGYLGSVFIH